MFVVAASQYLIDYLWFVISDKVHKIKQHAVYTAHFGGVFYVYLETFKQLIFVIW